MESDGKGASILLAEVRCHCREYRGGSGDSLKNQQCTKFLGAGDNVSVDWVLSRMRLDRVSKPVRNTPRRILTQMILAKVNTAAVEGMRHSLFIASVIS